MTESSFRTPSFSLHIRIRCVHGEKGMDCVWAAVGYADSFFLLSFSFIIWLTGIAHMRCAALLPPVVLRVKWTVHANDTGRPTSNHSHSLWRHPGIGGNQWMLMIFGFISVICRFFYSISPLARRMLFHREFASEPIVFSQMNLTPDVSQIILARAKQ